MAAPSHDGAITIYAELLSNIRQVSVVASLASASDSHTRADVTENGTEIRIHHGDEVHSLTLPARVAVSSQLPLPGQSTNVLSWRLPMPKDADSLRLPGQAPVSQSVPWDASSLQPGSTIHCRNCSSIIVTGGSIVTWKDLPSEDWAEMMEFWHCHKPHDHNHDHDQSNDHHKQKQKQKQEQEQEEHLTRRGYGASSAITARPGVGFVALTSFLLSETDCEGLSVS